MSEGGNSSGNGDNKSVLGTVIIVIMAVVFIGIGYAVLNGDTNATPPIQEETASDYNAAKDEAEGEAEEETATAEATSEESSSAEEMTEETSESETSSSETEQTATEESTEVETTEESSVTAAENTEDTVPETKTDDRFALKNLAKPRIMGDPKAPVKLTEHASFTCPHCADFHKSTLKKIKKEYIDTGKVYLEFSDFPTNYPAVHASMVARCVPDKNYFNFVRLLFETQDEWARKANYKEILKQDALIAGLDEKTFEKCINNKELEKALLAEVEEAHNRHGIGSVPSVIVNNVKVIAGAQPFEQYQKAIEDALAKAKASQTQE